MSFEIDGNKLVRYIHEKGTKSISIPEGVEIIKSGAFIKDDEEMESLKQIILPKSLRIIDKNAFRFLNVEQIVVQDGLKEIRKNAFCCCYKLKEINLPETLEFIGEEAFEHCEELKNVTVPAGVRVLPKGVFYGCSKLKEIVLSEGLTTIEESVICGVIEIRELVIPASVTTILPGAFRNCNSWAWNKEPKLTEIKVEIANENYVTGSDGAVYSKDMKTLIAVPNKVKAKSERFIIPDGIEKVESFAFYSNETIREVVIPGSVLEIGTEAFSKCSRLNSIDLSNGIKTIGAGAFSDCKSIRIRELVIPESVKSIGDGAFGETDIYTVILPISIEKIGSAFYNTRNLCKIEFVDNNPGVEKFNISILSIPKSCSNVVIPQRLSGTLHEFLISKESIDAYWTILRSDNLLEIASVMLYQGTKTWVKWLERYSSRANEIISKALELLEEENKMPSNVAKNVTAFATKFAKKIDEAALRKIIIELKNKGQQKVAETFENSAEIKAIISADSANPIEKYVNKYAEIGYSKVESVVQNGIKYADGSGVSSKKAVILIIARYRIQWHMYKSTYAGGMGLVEFLSEGYRLQKDEIADHVADALDRNELMKILEKQAYGTNYREYIIAFVRYADEKQIQEFVKTINAKSKSNAKDRWWAKTAENALYLSDCSAAAEYMDTHKRLDEYAKMRGMSESDYRDSRMIEDFGFDERGVISFDIGDKVIELSISEEATTQLFDFDEQKIIKGFPKKSADMEKLSECEKQFAEVNKRIEGFIAKRVECFNALYLNGQTVSHDIWVKTYLTHPIIKTLARLLIWKDANQCLFVVADEGPIDITNQPYSPVGDVKLAHILEMTESEIESWRKFLADRKQKQLFAQVWEPLVSVDVEKLNKRYYGAVISGKERNAFKKAMKIRGIEVKSASQEGEYDHSAGKYEFSNIGTMCIGDYAKLRYTVDEVTKDLTLGNLKADGANNRVLNVLVYELDKACIRAKIAKDEVEQIQIVQLDSYNLAQINEFINYASESKAVKCTAMLMDYKNKKHPDFEWLDSLILEL